MKPVIMVPPRLFSQYAIYNKHAIYVHSSWLHYSWFAAQLAETLHVARVPIYLRIDNNFLVSPADSRELLESIPAITHIFADIQTLYDRVSTVSAILYDRNFKLIGVDNITSPPMLPDDLENLLEELNLNYNEFGLAFKKDWDGVSGRERSAQLNQRTLNFEGPLIALGLWTDLNDFIDQSPSTVMDTLITSFPIRVAASGRTLDDGKPYPKNLDDDITHLPYPTWAKSAIESFINRVEAIEVKTKVGT